MNKKELDSVKHIEEQIKAFKLIIKVNKGLRFIGLGSKKISEMEEQIKILESQIDDFKNIPIKFNSYLSDCGWIAYDSINFDFMKEVIDVYESNGLDKAENKLLDYYKPENLDYELLRLKSVPQILRRYKFIDYAYEDYKNARYYSVIPILLIVIDGSINDVLGRGLHSENANMDVWDSITALDGGIEKIKNIFKKGRYKTTEDKIDIPFRNGILHGLDLGYDNYKVAAKCWHFLFVIRDWILSKESESNRFDKYLKDKNPPPITESIKKIVQIEKEKQAIKDWTARNISKVYLNSLSANSSNDDSLPETIVIQFLELWKKKNYGYMANIYWPIFFKNGKPNIVEIRNQFQDFIIENYKITKIIDESPAISEIEFECLSNNVKKDYKARLLFEGNDYQSHSRNYGNGKWKIVFIQEK